MKKPLISMIAAIGARNRVLGKDNDLLWHIPEDMKFFKETTTGHPVIMGRKTFDSFPDKFKPLPNRLNIVVTRNKDWSYDGVVVSNSIEEAIEKAREVEEEEIFIIGGAQIYNEGLKYTDKLYLTLVESDEDGDTFFPLYSEFNNEISRRESSDENYRYTFVELMK